MKVSAQKIPALSDARLLELRDRARLRLRWPGVDHSERQRWARFLKLAEAELHRRAEGGSGADADASSPIPRRPLPVRLADAQDALYGVRERERIKAKADAIRQEWA